MQSEEQGECRDGVATNVATEREIPVGRAQSRSKTSLTAESASREVVREEMRTRITELEMTAATLTAWNGSLEARIVELQSKLANERNQAAAQLRRREEELIELTRRQIALKQEIDQGEGANRRLQRALAECEEIVERLKRENAILKFKVQSCMAGDHRDGAPDPVDGIATGERAKRRFEALPELQGIGEVVVQLKACCRRS